MNMNPLPPQAYTKDTLVQAYAWLQTQNECIKEMATNPDILVSLYLKAKLQGDSALERPSIQNFKTELKNLAGMIGEFEIVEPESTTVRIRSQDLKAERSSAKISTEQAPAATTAHRPDVSAKAPSSVSKTDLDTEIQVLIQEVKCHFHLSSDNEALRMLVSIGYNQVKHLFRKP
ncbi:MAG: hypothetical protein COT73_02450 [Bdellovibrio sp. CG10_big_fil_rev_8_21_14_0_10_47_8]|nr:MAG: hypothetical protein COT73_02450 [Bdellovibrio sp. CG10_big_fil_rev_8_21_14_0_10_47_8]